MRGRLPVFTLRPWLFLHVSTTLAALAFVGAVLLDEPLSLYRCEHEFIPSVQQRFGFVVERIQFRDLQPGLLAIVSVVEGGILARAGFRSKDVPYAPHVDGAHALCAALKDSLKGRDGDLYVWNVDRGEWHGDMRELTIPAFGVPRPAGGCLWPTPGFRSGFYGPWLENGDFVIRRPDLDTREAYIIVEFRIDEAGVVTDVCLVRGVDPDIDHSALELARRWRFSPPRTRAAGLVRGVFFGSWTVVPVVTTATIRIER